MHGITTAIIKGKRRKVLVLDSSDEEALEDPVDSPVSSCYRSDAVDFSGNTAKDGDQQDNQKGSAEDNANDSGYEGVDISSFEPLPYQESIDEFSTHYDSPFETPYVAPVKDKSFLSMENVVNKSPNALQLRNRSIQKQEAAILKRKPKDNRDVVVVSSSDSDSGGFFSDSSEESIIRGAVTKRAKKKKSPPRAVRLYGSGEPRWMIDDVGQDSEENQFEYKKRLVNGSHCRTKNSSSKAAAIANNAFSTMFSRSPILTSSGSETSQYEEDDDALLRIPIPKKEEEQQVPKCKSSTDDLFSDSSSGSSSDFSDDDKPQDGLSQAIRAGSRARVKPQERAMVKPARKAIVPELKPDTQVGAVRSTSKKLEPKMGRGAPLQWLPMTDDIPVDPRKARMKARALVKPAGQVEAKDTHGSSAKVQTESSVFPDIDDFYYYYLTLPKSKNQKNRIPLLSMKSKYRSSKEYLNIFIPMLFKSGSSGSFDATGSCTQSVHRIKEIKNYDNNGPWSKSDTSCNIVRSSIGYMPLSLLTFECQNRASYRNYDLIHVEITLAHRKVAFPTILVSPTTTTGDSSDLYGISCFSQSDDKVSILEIEEAISRRAPCTFIPSRSLCTVQREFDALIEMPRMQDWVKALILAPGPNCFPKYAHSTIGKFASVCPALHSVLKQNFNSGQLVAVEESVGARPCTLIQGPPGTGKTKTILGIVSSILAGVRRALTSGASNGQRIEVGASLNAIHESSNLNPIRILLCAPSNAAVNEVVRRLLGEGVWDANGNKVFPNIVHVGRCKNSPLVVKQVNIDTKLQYFENTPSFYEERLKLLRAAQVVCCTLSSAGSKYLQDSNIEFETVIIDEAAQATEPSSMIPFTFQPKHIVLVGDHKQLPAMVFSQPLTNMGYDRSLFERLYLENYPATILNHQYRMHDSICRFPSNEFYRGKLFTHSIVRTRPQPQFHENYFFDSYLFFNVPKGVEFRSSDNSRSNETEADFVAQLLESLAKFYPKVIRKTSIGIITPYKHQTKNISTKLRRVLGHKIMAMIEIDTVDSFQGREKDIIIFSCVRSGNSPGDGIGFLSDTKRLNVAITRAKHSLWIVGDCNQLTKHNSWRNLIDDSYKRNRVVNYRDFDPSGRKFPSK